jgi:hypothetical protein
MAAFFAMNCVHVAKDHEKIPAAHRFGWVMPAAFETHPCHHRAGAKRRDPVIPIHLALYPPKREGRDKPGHDVESLWLRQHSTPENGHCAAVIGVLWPGWRSAD